MYLCVTLQASQPNGANYRLAIGCLVPPKLVWLVVVLIRLI